MKNKNIIMRSYVLLGLTALVLFLWTPGPAMSTMSDYCSVPPFLSNTVPPNVMFLLDNSGSMNCVAYPGDYDPTRFASGNYYGLFDPTTMYQYSSNNWSVTTANPSTATTANPIASGNFLNWMNMRRIDVAKRLLNGGKANPRSPASGFTVKLVGEVPQNGSYCDEDQTVGTFDNSGSIPESHLPAPYTNVIYPFSGNFRYTLTHTGLNVTPVAGGTTNYDTLPISDVLKTNWTLSGATTAFDAVDDPVGANDGNATYIKTTSVTSPVLLGYNYTAPTSGTISSVSIIVRAKKSISSKTLRMQGVYKISGTNYADAYQAVSSTNYTTYTFSFGNKNPATNAAWQWTDINAALQAFGVQISYTADATNILTVTQIYLEVSIATPSGGPYAVVIDTGKSTADRGIIGSLSNSARFGLANYNTDAQGAKVVTPIDFGTPTSMITSIDNMQATTNTPLAESLYTLTKYFRQETPPYHAPNGDYKTGSFSVNDPYYYMYSALGGSTTDRYMPCAKSYILLMTDGEPTGDDTFTGWPASTTDSDGNGSRLDNVALWARTADARPGTCSGDQSTWTWPCIPKTQNVFVYSVFMFGQGSDLLKKTAINGGFEDINNNGIPACTNTTVGHPTQEELKACYRNAPDNATRTINPGILDPAQDPPLTYYEGDDGYALQASIVDAITAMLKRAASGTAVSVLTTSSRGVGSMIQAYFLPIMQDGLREVTWTGYTQNIWLDPDENLRADTVHDYNLKLDEDNVEMIYFDEPTSETLAASFTTDATGNGGSLAACTPVMTTKFSDLSYLWEGGKKLALTLPSYRNIFTSSKVVNGTSTTFTFSSNAFTVSNVTSNGSLNSALNPDATYTSENIVRYVRGECLETGMNGDVACGSTTNANYRDRRITKQSDGTPLPGGDPNGNVWKLGDIISATPKVLAGTPLNSYDIVFGDTTYRAYVSTDNYKHRSAISIIGANDGMLHAFRVGYLQDTSDSNFTLLGGIKAVFKNFFADTSVPNPGSSSDQLGKEVWAYVPFNAFPYLKYLADPQYCHIYFNDLPVTLVDVSTGGNPSAVKPADGSSWQTVLIGGMRFGGSCSGGINPAGPPSGTPVNVGFSVFYGIDVTDPENPVVLWEFSDADMGYATSFPAVLRTGGKDKNGNWYIVFGTGSKQLPKSGQDLNRTTAGYVYILDLKTGALAKKIALDHNAIVSDILSVDADLNYKTEKIYFGTAYKSTTWKGKIASIDIPDQDLSVAWTPTIKYLFTDNYPFTASPDAVLDATGTTWVFDGSGKYESDVDQTDTSQQVFVGFRVADAITYPLSTASLDNRTYTPTTGTVTGTTTRCMFSSATGSFGNQTMVTSINSSSTVAPSTVGWYLNLVNAAGERAISKPLAVGGLVDFLSFIPNADLCSAGGDSYLYSLAFNKGVAPEIVSIRSPEITSGATSGSVTVKKSVKLGPGAPPKGEAIIIPPKKPGSSELLNKKIQVSTGVIIEATNNPIYSVVSKVIQWLKK